MKSSRQSYADQKRKNQKTMDIYAAMADKPTVGLAPVREKREASTKSLGLHRSEHQEQVTVIHWWRVSCNGFNLPEFCLFSIPNGGSRNVIEAVNLKAEGVRSGVPDLFLSVPRGGLSGFFIELKVGKNKPSDKQIEFVTSARLRGYKADVFWSADDVISAIKKYLNQP